MSLIRIISLTAILSGLANYCAAATVVMANGEQFNGSIIKMKNAELLLKNTYVGQLKLPWSEVVEIISEQPLKLYLHDDSLISSAVTSSGQAGTMQLTTAPSATAQVLELAQIVAINSPQESPYDYHWRGKSNVGLTATSGNSDTTRFHVDGEATLENEFNRYIVGVDFNRGSDNNVTSVENWTAYGSYDHFLSKKLFWNNNISFKQNGLQELSLRSAVGSGIGYQFHDDDALRLSTTAGLSYVSESFTVAPTQEFLAAQFGLDYEQQWFDWLRFFHNLTALVSLEDFDDFVLRSRSGLRYPVTDAFVTSLQVNFDYDNSPSEGAEKEDIIYSFTLGYNW